MLKRPFVFFIVFFVLGVCVAQMNISLIYISIASLLFATYALARNPRLMGIVFIAVVGLFFGMGRYMLGELKKDALTEKYDGETINAEMLALDFATNNSFPAQIVADGKKLKVYAYIEDCPKIEAGDMVSAKLSLSTPQKDKNSSADFESYLSGINIYLSAYAKNATILDKTVLIPRSIIYNIRKGMGSITQKSFKGDTRALFSAMVYGDKRFFSKELSELLQKAGQNHIAVVSGMHLSIMSSVIMMIIGMFFGKKRIGNILAIGAVLFMTLITGAGASVVRACIMCVIYHVSKLFRRESDSLTALSVSAFLMIIYNPFIIQNAGFILSVLSVLGIILYSERFTRAFMKFMPKSAAAATGMCVGAQMTVTPAVMYYFGILTPYALIANLLIFAFSSLIVIIGLCFIALSWVPILSTFLKAIVEILAETIIAVCEFIEKLPFASVNTGGLNFIMALFLAVALISVYFYPRHKKALRKLYAITILICTVSVFWNMGKTKIRILDYPSGDCLFLSNGENSVLIGCEDSDDAVILSDRYASGKIATTVQTSDDEKELYLLAQSGKTKSVVLNKKLSSNSFIDRMKKTGVETIILTEGEELFVDKFIISYDKSGEVTKNAVVEIYTEKESLITAQSLNYSDILLLYENGESFYSTYFIAPHTFSKSQQLLNAMVNAKNITGQKQIFIKR